MTIDRVELFLLKLPYVHPFETSFGRESDRTFIIVTVNSSGLRGYGEVVAAQRPLFSYETTMTAWHVLEDFFIPLLFQEHLEEPEDFAAAARRYRGHPMARAGLELALWDLKAKKKGFPLYCLYGGTQREIPAGVSIGIQDSPETLLDRIASYLEEGYQRIKIKIKPGWDHDICRRVRLRFPDILFQVDANGAYSPQDGDHLKSLDEFSLLLLEQPFPPYDLWDHAGLQKRIKTPLCLDESIISAETARQALEMGSCRIINIKVGRVGGIVEARRIHDCCRERSIPVWCGGMLESGIGRAHNIHLASLPNFSLPNDLSASRRYYVEDIVEPEIMLTGRGTIRIPEGAGIGITPRDRRIAELALRYAVFTAKSGS